MRGFAHVLSADVASKVLLGIASIALIRYMPTQNYAALTFAVTVGTIGAQILAAGFNRIYILAFEPLGLGERLGPYLAAQCWLLAAMIVAGLPLLSILGAAYPLVALLAAGLLLSEFAKTFYQRELAFDRYSALEVGRALGQACGIGALIGIFGTGLAAEAVVAVQGAALLASFALALGLRRRWRGLLDVHATKALLRDVLRGPYGTLLSYFSVVALFSQIDIVMLRTLADDVQLASYGSAFRYYAFLMLALGAVHAVLLPRVQRAQDASAVEGIYEQHLRLLVFFAAIALAAGWMAHWVLPWVDQGRYPDAVPAFRILCASAVVSFACSPYANVLMKRHRFRVQLHLILAGLCIALVLHAILIPGAGAIGAAWATLISTACVTVPVALLARREGL